MKTLNHSKCVIFLALWISVILGACEKGPNFREFIYPAPVVNDFHPKQGYIGSTITIDGKDFGTTIKAVKVYFGGVQAGDPVTVADDKIEVLVPENAIGGKVIVEIYGKKDETEGEFVLMPSARITAASTDKAEVGAEVTIAGENFGTDASLVKVFIGSEDHEAQIVSVTETEIRFLTPDAPSGNIIAVVDGQWLTGPYIMVGVEKLVGTLFGHAGSWQNNPATMIQAAVDGDLTTFVDGAATVGYVGYDMGATKGAILKSVRFAPRSTHASRMVNGEIRGANDPTLSDYVVLHTITATPPVGVMTEVKIEDPEEKSYRYIYYYTATGNGNIAEIEFYGNVKDVPIPVGKFIWEFGTDNDNEGWVPQQGAPYTVSGGALNVTFPQTSGNKRADLMYTKASTATPIVVHPGNYPIIAMKMVGKPAGARITFDVAGDASFGNAFNQYSTDYADQEVYYWNMSTLGNGTNPPRSEPLSLRIFQFKVADIPPADPATGYKLEWIRTFESKEKLAEFLGL